MLSLIIDGIILLIIVFCIVLSAKHGFVRTLVEVVGGILVIYLAVTLSNPIAKTVYEKAIEPSVVSAAEESIKKSAEKTSDTVWKSFPKIVTNNAEFFGISKNSISVGEADTKKLAKTAADAVAKPMIIRILATAVSTVAIILLLILVRFSARILNSFFNFSILGKVNRTLGGVLGIFKGILFSFLFCIIVMFILSVKKNGFFIFTNESVSNTVIFKYLYGVLPFKF